jgi:hypothetical protein
MKDNMNKLHFIAQYLIENEIMDDEQFRVAMTTDATLEELVAIRDRKLEQSKSENEEADATKPEDKE